MTTTPPNPPRNRQGTIEIELEMHERAVAAMRENGIDDQATALAFSYGVLQACISDPDRLYSRAQLLAVIAGLDRAVRAVAASA